MFDLCLLVSSFFITRRVWNSSKGSEYLISSDGSKIEKVQRSVVHSKLKAFGVDLDFPER